MTAKRLSKRAVILIICAAVLCAVLLILFVLWPFADNSPQQLEQYITRVLTVPDAGVQDALSLEDVNQEARDTAFRQAMEALAGDEATESMVESLVRLSGISALHFVAVQKGFTITPVETTVTLNSATSMIYDFVTIATVVCDNTESFSVTLTGRIQLNEDGKIRYMDADYSDIFLIIGTS